MEDEGIGIKARLVSMLLRLLTLGLIAVALMISTEGIVIVVLLFVLVVPFEKLFPRHRGQKVRRPHLDTDVGYALASPLMGLLTGFVAIAIGLLSLAWIPGLLVAPYVAKIPEAYLPVVGFLLFDALVYWTHRFYHEIPVLWKFHAIHHSTEHLDWASGFRAHPLDGTILAPAFVFLVTAGFSFELTGALAAAQLILGLFLHANVRWRLSGCTASSSRLNSTTGTTPMNGMQFGQITPRSCRSGTSCSGPTSCQRTGDHSHTE